MPIVHTLQLCGPPADAKHLTVAIDNTLSPGSPSVSEAAQSFVGLLTARSCHGAQSHGKLQAHSSHCHYLSSMLSLRCWLLIDILLCEWRHVHINTLPKVPILEPPVFVIVVCDAKVSSVSIDRPGGTAYAELLAI